MFYLGHTQAVEDLSANGSCPPARSGTRLAKAVLLLSLAVFAVLLPQPGLWAASSPASCPVNFSVQSISLTDWEAGLGAWTVGTYDLAQPGRLRYSRLGRGRWPARRPDRKGCLRRKFGCGRLSRAARPVRGLDLDQPIYRHSGRNDTPQIALNHWFDIEYGWDGGNLKISVNGGAFTLVPGSAFETGPYTDVLFEAFR